MWDLVVMYYCFGGVCVLLELMFEWFCDVLGVELVEILVISGFVVCFDCGVMIYFGCGGFDLMVVFVVVVFGVDVLEIWIDVDGVLIVDLCDVFEV